MSLIWLCKARTSWKLRFFLSNNLFHSFTSKWFYSNILLTTPLWRCANHFGFEFSFFVSWKRNFRFQWEISTLKAQTGNYAPFILWKRSNGARKKPTFLNYTWNGGFLEKCPLFRWHWTMDTLVEWHQNKMLLCYFERNPISFIFVSFQLSA